MENHIEILIRLKEEKLSTRRLESRAEAEIETLNHIAYETALYSANVICKLTGFIRADLLAYREADIAGHDAPDYSGETLNDLNEGG
jgi:hypothetical protein